MNVGNVGCGDFWHGIENLNESEQYRLVCIGSGSIGTGLLNVLSWLFCTHFSSSLASSAMRKDFIVSVAIVCGLYYLFFYAPIRYQNSLWKRSFHLPVDQR